MKTSTSTSQVFEYPACTDDYIERVVQGYTFRAILVHDEYSSPYEYTGEGWCFDLNCPDYGEYNRGIVQAWEDNAWEYVGVVLQVRYNGILLDAHTESLWGLEMNFPNADNSHLTAAAEELMYEALDRAKDVRADMLRALQGCTETN